MIEKLLEIPNGFWAVLGQMAPYLLFGFLVAGLLSVLISQRVVERHLGGRGVWPVIKAAILGVPLPLCSCGVIPVSASLKRHGATRGATTSFLLSTPQTGVDSIMVTFSLLGPVFAVFRPIAALLTGIVGGTLVNIFDRSGNAQDVSSELRDEACCTGEKRHSGIVRALHYGFVTLVRDIAKPLLAGLLVAGVISAFVPEDFFTETLGTGITAMLVMMALGIPIYVCATASVPIAAALMLKGVSPGAALVFLIAGPATNAATITTVWKVMGKRTAVIYLGTVAAAALGWGLLLDQVYALLGASAAPLMDEHVHSVLPAVVNGVAAVVLLGVIAAALIPRPKRTSREAGPEAAERIEFGITGMTCSHCAQTVRRALAECQNVHSAEVDLRTAKAVVTGTGLDPTALRRAVEAIGYGVKEES